MGLYHLLPVCVWINNLSKPHSSHLQKKNIVTINQAVDCNSSSLEVETGDQKFKIIVIILDYTVS